LQRYFATTTMINFFLAFVNT